MRRLFTQLVTPGDDSDDLRRRATVEELADVAAGVIEAYRANRLLVTDHHPVTREPTVEVAHEALLREWPRLADWIDEDRDAIRVRRALTLAAHEWQATPADESTLYRGTRLEAADHVARTLTPHAAASRISWPRATSWPTASGSSPTSARWPRSARTVDCGGSSPRPPCSSSWPYWPAAFAVQQSRQSDRDAAAATQARILADAERLAPIDRDVVTAAGRGGGPPRAREWPVPAPWPPPC